MIVAGLGCRRGVTGADVVACFREALARSGLDEARIVMLAAPVFKQSEPGLLAAAGELRLPLVFVSDAELGAADARVSTRSEKVIEMKGLGSVAEAAALAAAGNRSYLLQARLAKGPVTCALATGGPVQRA